MYPYLLFIHSLLRWLVLLSLTFACYRAVRGRVGNKPFTKFDDSLRHITATIAHTQLVVGYLLYFNSPFITYFRQHYQAALKQFDYLFFGLVHISLMTIAVICITVGSSYSKRKDTGEEKFKTMALWFTLALVIILVAIPWPFSPLAKRPFIRTI